MSPSQSEIAARVPQQQPGMLCRVRMRGALFVWSASVSTASLLPRLPPHRPSAAVRAAYEKQVAVFCTTILEVRSRLDFEVGTQSTGVKWFLANGQIADDVAQRIVTRADVKPVDAGLFADCAQSYRIDPDA